ncbi:hypothetical protein I317_00985 [Kwoniella heveanensis CBS 569]|nr:hypothetical protein I317_00985 [Kwoniella heveanensis CBS 569]
MPMHSIFYFLPPTYECHESQTIMKDLNSKIYCQYVSLFADTLQSHVSSATAAVASTNINTKTVLTEDLVWDVIHQLMDQLRLDKKPKLLVPIRHALTERKKGPSIPELVTILGLDETLSRLRRGGEYVREQQRHRR